MKIIKQSWELLNKPNYVDMLNLIESAGRVCWKSEDKASGKPEEFIKSIMSKNHESVIEHCSATVRLITNRGVTHEIIRHRIGASYSQESTRYCAYNKDKFGNELTVILPVWIEDSTSDEIKIKQYNKWVNSMKQIESDYFELLSLGWKAQQAREILPNSLKTELVMTMNMRAWRHFFQLRSAQAAHPQIRELTLSLLEGFKKEFPVFFCDISS